MRFRQEVVEVQCVRRIYEVEADSLEEAAEMVENGETVSERDVGCVEVQSRVPYSKLKRVDAHDNEVAAPEL